MLERLEQAHDGPLPWGVATVALAGGPGRWLALVRAAGHRLHQRRAAELVQALACRRAQLAPEALLSDGWLNRLGQALAQARASAVVLSAGP